MRISDWSSDVCSSDLVRGVDTARGGPLMDRDRDDDPRRPGERGRGRDLLGSDRHDPPAGKFDPAEFDMPTDPPPSAAGRARGAADAAQAHSFFSHLDTNIQRILAGFGTLRDLVTDVRASLADAAARDAQIGRAHV